MEYYNWRYDKNKQQEKRYHAIEIIFENEINKGKKTNQTITIFLIIVLLTWFVPNYMRGIDVTDTSYSLVRYKTALETSPQLLSFPTLMTDLIGSLIYKFFPHGQYLALSLSNALAFTFGSMFLLKMTKDFLPLTMRLIIAIVGNFFALTNMHSFNYNTTSFFFLSLLLLSLSQSFEFNYNKSFIISGLIAGLNIFTRFPNILHLTVFFSVIWYYCVCERASFRIALKKLDLL